MCRRVEYCREKQKGNYKKDQTLKYGFRHKKDKKAR